MPDIEFVDTVDDLAEDTSPALSTDFLITKDTSAGLLRRVKPSNLLALYATLAAVAAGYQPLDADLTAIAALSTTSFGRSLLAEANAAAVRALLGIGPMVDLTDAATIATDASLGHRFRVTLGGSRTLGNPTNAYDGQSLVWELIQDGSGLHTITLDTKFAFGTDITGVTLTTTASKRDFLTAIYDANADKFYVLGFVKGY